MQPNRYFIRFSDDKVQWEVLLNRHPSQPPTLCFSGSKSECEDYLDNIAEANDFLRTDLSNI